MRDSFSYKIRQVRDVILFQIFARLANVVLMIVLAVFGFIFYRSIQFWVGVSATNIDGSKIGGICGVFCSGNWFPDANPPEFGMLSLFYGSFIVTATAMLVAIPVGIFSAVVLSDLVSFRVRQILKPMIELPAAVPSVAFGFFAIKIVAPFLQDNFGFASGANVINAAIILAIMAIPTIVSVSEDAMSGIGREIREASYALGATRAETIIKVVIPAAWNGIAAAVILGVMRAVGETMVVWMAAGNAANMPEAIYRIDQVVSSLGGAVRTMTATIAGDIGETPADSLHRSALFAVGLMLLLFTFAMNLLTEFITHHKKHTKEEVFKTTENTEEEVFSNTKNKKGIADFFKKLLLPFRAFRVKNPPLCFLCSLWFKTLPFRGSRFYRWLFDICFTCCSVLSLFILFFSVGLVIVPIFGGGLEAVYFKETVEHRLFISDKFQRGDRKQIEEEFRQCYKFREPVYARLRKLSWLCPEDWIAQSAKLARGNENRKLKRLLQKLYNANSNNELKTHYNEIKNLPQNQNNQNNEIIKFVDEFYNVAQNADLSIRDKFISPDSHVTYSSAFKQIRGLVNGVEGTGCILGLAEREGVEHLPAEVRYGAAHWSSAKKFLEQLKYATVWKQIHDPKSNKLTNKKTIVERASLFEGTEIADEIRLLVNDFEVGMEAMLNPRQVFYGFYFIDSATAGHYLGGVGAELLGTTLISLMSILIALPLGLITAAYLVESAKDNTLTRLIRLCVNTLAGVPSVVFGLFGLAVIVEFITGKPSLLAGSITLAILILPVVIRTSEEAIRSVPQTYREAAIALGAGSLRVFLTVTFPAALPGILTGIILGISRAAGETAPLLFTCAVASGGFVGGSNLLFQPTPVLSYAAYDMTVGDRIATIVPHNQYGLVATLILFVLLFNIAAIALRAKITNKLRGN
ncbi:MAG: phosphate ABC transporter permease subunit PstC [Planctomycetaceae bacterium]|jgi:phosphate ABC transporter permease protein PstC/phosphate ABC transporter permease subunit PstA|nr:phosphate ABC transporter permease subunit PstC [Planctomycetaceae bacterium]